MRRIRTVLAALAVIAGVASALGAPAGATGVHDPRGHVDQASFSVPKYGGDGRTHITGWAADPDLGTAAGLTVRFYVDGGYAGAATTGLSRPDVARAYPRYGTHTGFSAAVPMPVGTHTVCSYAINRGTGSNASLGCTRITQASSGYLIGHIESITVSGATPQMVTFRGWALDPTDRSQAPMHYGIAQGDNGITTALAGLTTSIPRPDVARAYPGRNASSGFEVSWTRSGVSDAFVSGRATCIYLLDSGVGNGPVLYQRAPLCTTFPLPPE